MNKLQIIGLLIGSFYFCWSCSKQMVESQPTKWNLLTSKTEIQKIGAVEIESITNYEYDTTDIEPQLIAENNDNYVINYEYISPTHVVANYTNYINDEPYMVVDYYLDSKTRNVLKKVVNDTTQVLYKYDANGYLINNPDAEGIKYEYQNGNLVSRSYPPTYQEVYTYLTKEYKPPFQGWFFGKPNKNILEKLSVKFNNDLATPIGYTQKYTTVLNSDGLIETEVKETSGSKTTITYEYQTLNK